MSINPKVVLDIIALLDEYLPKNLYASDFTMEHYNYLLSKLMPTVNEEFFNDKKGAIKKGLTEYFAKNNQKVDVIVSFKDFTIKKHFFLPSKPEAYDRMLHKNESIIADVYNHKDDYMPLPFLISIPEKIRTQILEGFTERNETIDTARTITRQQINTVFSTSEKDIIFFLRGRIFIRFYTPPKKFAPGQDSRFAGEPVEVMEELYAHYFPNGAWESIESILPEVLNDRLNFSVIDNLTFTKTFIAVFRSMVEIVLLDILKPKHRNKIEGFTGYVLRIYFHQILVFIAKNLLGYIEIRDKNAEAFIKYFADEVVVDASGNRIQKNAIVDSKNQRWNYTSIISIVMQYKQSKIKLESHKEAITASQERVTETQHEINAEIAAQRKIIDRIAEIELLISENEMILMQQKSKNSEKPEESLTVKSTVARLNKRQDELLSKKKSDNGKLEIANGKIANKNSELARRQKKLDHDKKALKSLMEQIETIIENYDLIVEAISIVLPKR